MTTTPEVPMPEPSLYLAHDLGAGKDAQTTEADRLAFEAWMRGHCWALRATWHGSQYKSDAEDGGRICPDAMRTRMMWAAWRDRGAVAADQFRAYADARSAKLQAELAAAEEREIRLSLIAQKMQAERDALLNAAVSFLKSDDDVNQELMKPQQSRRTEVFKARFRARADLAREVGFCKAGAAIDAAGGDQC